MAQVPRGAAAATEGGHGKLAPARHAALPRHSACGERATGFTFCHTGDALGPPLPPLLCPTVTSLARALHHARAPSCVGFLALRFDTRVQEVLLKLRM